MTAVKNGSSRLTDSELRYLKARAVLRTYIEYVPDREKRKKLEIEAAHLFRKVTEYGFNFVPWFYQYDSIQAIERMGKEVFKYLKEIGIDVQQDPVHD